MRLCEKKKKKKERTSSAAEITEGHVEPRLSSVRLKRKKGREGGPCAPLFLPAVRVMTACARGGVRFSESRGSRASTQLERKRGRKERDRGKRKDEEGAHREEGSESGVYRGAPGDPRGLLAAARNAHLKRGRNGRGAPGVFLTRIPDVRASHLFVLLSIPPYHVRLDSFCSSRPPLVPSTLPLPFGFLILSSCLIFLFSSSFGSSSFLSSRLGIICRCARARVVQRIRTQNRGVLFLFTFV